MDIFDQCLLCADCVIWPVLLDYGVSRKVSKDGKYLGVVGDYDFDDKKAKLV